MDNNQVIQIAQKRAINDPQWFFKNVLMFPAMDWQLEAVHAVFDVRRKVNGEPTLVNHKGKPRVTIRSCHGTGKTQFLAMLAHIWNFTTYGMIACTAPKIDQLTRRFLPRYRSCMAHAHDGYQKCIKVKGYTVELNEHRDHGIALETASDPDNLAGYHDKPQLFLVDEASAKRLDPMFPTIQGALTTPGSCIVEIGNPTRIEGEFYRHHMDKELAEMYYRMHIHYKDAKGLVSQEWIDYMATTYGKDSAIYKIRVLGEFASFDDYQLIELHQIDDCFNRDMAPDGSHPKIRVSVDVADGGADKTVITVARHYDSFVDVLMQKGYNWEPSVAVLKAADEAVRVFEDFGGHKQSDDDFVVDANGVGAGTAGSLIKGGYNVIRHVGSSTQNTNYRNQRVHNAMMLYKFIRDEKIAIDEYAIDNKEELVRHILSIKRASSDRIDDISNKESIKKLGLPSPDRFDSLSMQMIDYQDSDYVAPFTPELIGTTASANYDAGLI